MFYNRDGLLVYGAGQHKEVVRRAGRIRDRANNLFVAAEGLDRSLPKDQRFENLRTLLIQYFDGIVPLFALEDQIDNEVSRLCAEVGK